MVEILIGIFIFRIEILLLSILDEVQYILLEIPSLGQPKNGDKTQNCENSSSHIAARQIGIEIKHLAYRNWCFTQQKTPSEGGKKMRTKNCVIKCINLFNDCV